MTDVKKRNRRNAVGFALGSPLPIPTTEGDQTRLWINAPAMKLI